MLNKIIRIIRINILKSIINVNELYNLYVYRKQENKHNILSKVELY